MLLTTVALFKYKLLDLEPIAFKKIVKNMKAAVILVNDYYQIIDFNQTLAVNFPKVKIKINDNLESVFKNLQNDMEDEEVATEVLAYLGSQTKSHFKREVCFRTPVKRYFEVKIQPVFDRKKEIMAWIIVFNDISQYKYFSSQLNEKNIVLAEMNEELLALNDRLKAYADTVEELAITRERNRMARDVHDTLGHTLTVLITLLENAGLFCHKDPVETRERLVKAGQLARSGLQEIERSIAGQRPEKLESAHLHEALEKLFADYRQSGMKIKLIPEQPNSVYTPTCCDTIYSVCQEALTNSLRHGKATEAEVLLKPINGKITLHITDNGSGCEKPVAGIGLTGMKQRVASLQGNIRVGSLSPGGFRVEVELPLDYNPGLQVEV
jgi:signal transduction histidine kinase